MRRQKTVMTAFVQRKNRKYENQICFTVEMVEYCKKKFKKLTKKDEVLLRVTETFLKELKTNPYIGEKLEANFPGFRAIHYLGNKYRIVYKIVYEPVSTIYIYEVNHRKNSYSDLAKAIGKGK